MNSRIILTSSFDEANLNKMNKLVTKSCKKLCKVSLNQGVNRFKVDTFP